jgi:hypothetical protein
MPANDRIWLDNGQVLSPIGQETGEYGPECPVIGLQSWSLGISLENIKLVTKSHILKNKHLSGFERRKQEIHEEFFHNGGYRQRALSR